MSKANLFLRASALFGFLAVALGAFGAHSLERLLAPDALETFQVGVRYQFYHTLALLAVALLLPHYPSRQLGRAGYCFGIGILLFSGSIYLLATRELLGLWWSGLGIITPIGGVFFMLGWIFLLLATFYPKSQNEL